MNRSRLVYISSIGGVAGFVAGTVFGAIVGFVNERFAGPDSEIVIGFGERAMYGMACFAGPLCGFIAALSAGTAGIIGRSPIVRLGVGPCIAFLLVTILCRDFLLSEDVYEQREFWVWMVASCLGATAASTLAPSSNGRYFPASMTSR